MRPADTIIAVSSPPGRSHRGLIRISGDKTTAILRGFGVTPPPPREMRATRLPFGSEYMAEERLSGTSELPILLSFFPAPRSYTADDMAEMQCPGNPALLDRILHRGMALGARLAEPGEFTCRAFLAGKMDLPQAEGVAATIAAVSDSELHAAALLRQGRLGSFTAELVQQLADSLALVESGIDFTDQEDVVAISPADLDRRLAGIVERLDDLLAHSRAWGAIEALPRVVLVGQPSTGKSTLFNALLGRRRAVISPMAGTTRDIIAEPLTLTGAHGQAVEVMLVDIAGLDAAETALDREVQQQARRAIDTADLILSISDGRARFTDPQAAAASVHVQTMSDLRPPSKPAALAVCAVTGAGLDALRQRIAAALGDRAVSVAADLLALQPRHHAALHAALDRLRHARQLLAGQRRHRVLSHVELIAGSLRLALDDLETLGGKMTPDDVLGRIFARFCIGK